MPSDADIGVAIKSQGVDALPAEVNDIRAMLERVAGSELRDRIAGARRVARSCRSRSRSRLRARAGAAS